MSCCGSCFLFLFSPFSFSVSLPLSFPPFFLLVLPSFSSQNVQHCKQTPAIISTELGKPQGLTMRLINYFTFRLFFSLQRFFSFLFSFPSFLLYFLFFLFQIKCGKHKRFENNTLNPKPATP